MSCHWRVPWGGAMSDATLSSPPLLPPPSDTVSEIIIVIIFCLNFSFLSCALWPKPKGRLSFIVLTFFFCCFPRQRSWWLFKNKIITFLFFLTCRNEQAVTSPLFWLLYWLFRLPLLRLAPVLFPVYLFKKKKNVKRNLNSSTCYSVWKKQLQPPKGRNR